LRIEAELRALEAWALSEGAKEPLRRLLDALERGHTALRLNPEEIRLLKMCPAVGDGGQATPLVLGPDGMLQSWRYREAERIVGGRLKAMALAQDSPVGAEATAWLAKLFPSASGQDQARAIDLGLRRRLALISGGPGTGKTRTAAWLLALHLHQRPNLRCVLAAPTGKAARRLGASISGAGLDLPGDLAALKPALETIGDKARTLHSLLAWRPQEDRCGRDAQRPLALDLLIVDEASMMDILQWRALLAALPRTASLVVLGDPFQLQSVEAGRVLGVMLEAAVNGAMAGHHVALTENFRFAGCPGIGRLADALRQADIGAILRSSPPSKAEKPMDAEGLRAPAVNEALDRIWPELLALASASEPAAALKAAQSLRILCAVNDGPWGVDGLNRAVERRLAVWSQDRGHGPWCRPVVIQVNDPHSGLSNGDLGVLVPSPEGGRATFEQGGKLKSYAVSQLPDHVMAWAMSVHRSQGSEYDTVLVLLPPGGGMTDRIRGLVSPELLYTAVTRASRRVILCADEKALRIVCEPRPPRVTGLAQWLV